MTPHSLEMDGNFNSDISESGVLLPLWSLYVSLQGVKEKRLSHFEARRGPGGGITVETGGSPSAGSSAASQPRPAAGPGRGATG